MPVVPDSKLQDKIARLNEIRVMLNWLEVHPELINDTLHVSNHVFVYPPYEVDDDDKREYILDTMRPLVRILNDGAAIGGVRKLDSDHYYGYERTFGNGLVVSINAHNQGVCEFVDSDEIEEVTVLDIPDRVREEYTRTEKRAKVVRVCPKLFVD